MARARFLPVLAAVALAASVALGADKAKAEKALKEALAANNADGIQAACDDLIEVGGKDAFLAVLAYAGKVEAQAYWQLVGAAAGFRDSAALDELGRWVVANQAGPKAPIARDVLFGLQNNGSPKVLGPLAHVLEKGKLDLQLMVVDQLALLRSTDSVDTLIAAYKREEKSDEELRRRLENALQHLTGESFGDAANWDGWWKTQRPNGLPDRKGKKEKGGKATVAKPRDGEFTGTIEKLSKDRFVVLSGSYDEMEQILEKREIPYTLAKKTDFDQDPQKFLRNAWVVLVNCDDCYEGKPPGVPDSGGKRLSERTLALLKKWVEDEGGSLFTEDWGLIDVTGVLWPDKISTLTGGAVPPMTDEMTVKLTPSRGSTSHPLMRAVWQKPRAEPKGKKGDDDEQKTTEKVESPAQPLKHKWKVDNLSAAAKVVDPKGVTTLLDSDELAKATNGTVHVAVTFRVGKWAPKAGSTPTGAKATTTSEHGALAKGGRVLHTISHFGHQSSEDDGEALHNLLINLLLEAATRHGGALKK